MVVPITHCPSCQKEINDDDKFCQECGLKLKE